MSREANGGVRACGKFLISFSSSFTRNTANFQFCGTDEGWKIGIGWWGGVA
jgi:hypothetical protein